MSKLIKEAKLPSCEVTMNLLKEFESFLVNDVFNILSIKNDFYDFYLSISINDNFGQEIFKSIDAIPNIFSDSTNCISIDYFLSVSKEKIRNYVEDIDNIKGIKKMEDTEEKWAKIKEIENKIEELYTINNKNLSKISIDLKLSHDKYLTSASRYLKINYNGDNSRARMVSLYDAINKIMDNYKNHNYLYHPSVGIDALLFIIALLSIVLSIVAFAIKSYLSAIMLLSISLIYILYVGLAKKTHPYFLFYSRKSERYKKWNNWFVYNLLLVIIINVIFLILKNRFF